jgi:hypothetical protein
MTSEPKGFRTRKGNVTVEGRKKYGRSDGSYPISSKRSALAALKLRGHEKDPKKRAAIINRAAKFAPEAARAAREADREKHSDNLPTQQLTDLGHSQEYMSSWIPEADAICSGSYPSPEEAAQVESFSREVMSGYESTQGLSETTPSAGQVLGVEVVGGNELATPTAGTVLYTEIIMY